MKAKLIAKFQEPKLPDMWLLIAKGETKGTSPSDYGWCINSVAKNGNNPCWSGWDSIGEIQLLHTILMTHLGLSESEAEKLIESAHGDGLTVQARLQNKLHEFGL